MDFFSQNEASQLVKTALNAGVLKVKGVQHDAAESQAAAAVDAAYMLALYRELLGPEGAAATMEDSKKGQEQQQQFQQLMQQVVSQAQQPAEQVQQQPQQGQQNQQQPVQQQAQPAQESPSSAQQQQEAPQQGQQAAAEPQGQGHGDAFGNGGGAQADYRKFIPEAFRQHIPENPPGQ